MAISKENQGRIEVIATESLGTFFKVAEAAKSHLANVLPTSGSESLAALNTLTNIEAVKNIEQSRWASTEGCMILSGEPAIARVVVIDENGDKATYYICRAAPVLIDDAKIKLASYRSPVGRLAALPVGEEYTLQLGDQSISVEVLESASFHPTLADQEWDSRKSVLEGDAYGPLTVESLRALLKRDGEEIDAIDRLLEEESKTANVRQGLLRRVITKMDLRDQPILDQYQDDIFRLPLDSCLLILGAPGTGKTTTLIRRLGQKLDPVFLNEDERRAIETSTFGGKDDHAQSWIMFTPTELLKLYIKEAFNKEDIPAPNERITTWVDFRRNLARNNFHILHSATSSSSFVMKDTTRTLEVATETDQIAWFSDFDQWQKSVFWEEMRVSAQSLSENTAREISKLGSRILAILDTAGPKPQPGVFVSLMTVASEIQDLVMSMKETTDQKIRGALNFQINRDKQFLDDMAKFIEGLKELNDEPEDQDSEDEDESSQSRVGRTAAVSHYMRAVRAYARVRARKRSVGKMSRNGRLIEWIGDRSLSEQDLLDVGANLIVQSALRRFVNPVRRYIDRVPIRYRRYRRVRQGEQRWYLTDGFSHTDIHPLEVDFLLLAMIRGTDYLITGARSLRGTDNPAGTTLERVEQLYRTQVFVDEATDFSPIQLACMATLARPGTRSFFACGDFNQRVTSWGTRSVEEMKWAVPDMDTKRISVVYRQSHQLNDLAKQLAGISGDSTTDVVLPDHVDNDGVAPVLVKNMTEDSQIAGWLAERIVEIERFIHDLPSIAVLVNDEEKVRTIATALSNALEGQNIQVIACSDGQVHGHDSAVRVFNIHHIKGLEFEAAFFVGIDRLARLHPDLFDKYLYVGATRAATYLGITCEQELPASMRGLEELFGENWQ